MTSNLFYFKLNNTQREKERGQWAVYYTSPQSSITKFNKIMIYFITNTQKTSKKMLGDNKYVL